MGRTCVADLEADGLLESATVVWCGVFKDIKTGEVFRFGPEDVEGMLRFMDGCDCLIMHNGIGYDMPLLRKVHGYKYKGKVVDTLLMSRLQDPYRRIPKGCRTPHSVEAWGVRFGRHKPEHEDWSKFSPEMMHRCSEDVEIQHMIFNSLVQEGKGGDWAPANRLTHKLFEILQLQEEYGWLFNDVQATKRVHQLTTWMERIDRVLLPILPFRCLRSTKNQGVYSWTKKPFKKNGQYAQATMNFIQLSGLPLKCRPVMGPYSRLDFQKVDLGSNAQVKEYLLSQGWIPREWNYKDGKPTSPKMKHDDPFEGINGGVGRLIAKRVQCRHRRSQIQGWVDNQRKDGRVAQSIGTIATTGRLTHRGIVNVPGGGTFYGTAMRKLFISKPGYSIIGVDSAGCQNRMLAGRVGDPAFTKTLIEGAKEAKTSIHYVNQRAIKAIAGIDATYKVCKNLNYAFMFGATDPKLASVAGVSTQQGAMIRKALLSVSPGLERLVNELTTEWRRTAKKEYKWGKVRYSGGIITGLDGRPIRIEKEHTLLVYVLQSDEAIMMQYALCFLYKWCTERGWTHGKEYGFIANIHDEFQTEVRDDCREEFARLGRDSIRKAGEFLGIACEHKGESEVGRDWSETH
jgi:hypothetical protein